MEIEKFSFCLLDMKKTKDSEVDTSNLPSIERFIKYIETYIEKMKKIGIGKIKEIYVTFIDLSESDNINVR